MREFAMYLPFAATLLWPGSGLRQEGVRTNSGQGASGLHLECTGRLLDVPATVGRLGWRCLEGMCFGVEDVCFEIGFHRGMYTTREKGTYIHRD